MFLRNQNEGYCPVEQPLADLPVPSRSQPNVETGFVDLTALDYSSSVVSLRTRVKRLSPRPTKKDSTATAFRSMPDALIFSGSSDSPIRPNGLAKRNSNGTLVIISCLVLYIRDACCRIKRAFHTKTDLRRKFFFTGDKITPVGRVSSGKRPSIQGKQHCRSFLRTYSF